MVVEPLDGHHVHCRSALRVVGVQRHPVPEVVQRNSEIGDRRPLLLVHGASDGPRLSRRSGDVEQQQDRKIAPPTQAVEIDRLVGHRAGHHLHALLNGRIDVDVVTLRLAMPAMQPHSEPGQRPSHADGGVDGLRR